VLPLTCTVDPTDTLAPLVLKVATKAVTSVPHGILTVMVFAFSPITPEAVGLANEKEVIALVSEPTAGGGPPPPPHRIAKTARHTKRNSGALRA
jgi:hypothetical protein